MTFYADEVVTKMLRTQFPDLKIIGRLDNGWNIIEEGLSNKPGELVMDGNTLTMGGIPVYRVDEP